MKSPLNFEKLPYYRLVYQKNQELNILIPLVFPSQAQGEREFSNDLINNSRSSRRPEDREATRERPPGVFYETNLPFFNISRSHASWCSNQEI